MPRCSKITVRGGARLLAALVLPCLLASSALAAGPWCQVGWRHRAASRAAAAHVTPAGDQPVAAETRFVLVQPVLQPVLSNCRHRTRHRGPQFGYPAAAVGVYSFPWGWFGARRHDDLSISTGYYEQYTDWSWFFSN